MRIRLVTPGDVVTGPPQFSGGSVGFTPTDNGAGPVDIDSISSTGPIPTAG